MIVTTTDNIEGYKIIEYLGLVNHSGTNGFLLSKGAKKITDELVKKVEKEIDADAIIGLRFINYDDVSVGKYHIYGTAVKIEKI